MTHIKNAHNFFFVSSKNSGVSTAGKLSRRGGTQIDQFGKVDPNGTTLCKNSGRKSCDQREIFKRDERRRWIFETIKGWVFYNMRFSRIWDGWGGLAGG